MIKVFIDPHYEYLRPWIEGLHESFCKEGSVIYKGRNVVRKIVVAGENLIVKRYKKPNFFQRLAYSVWRKSKAVRAFLYAGRLNDMGVDSPAGIGVVEVYENLLFSYGYFISSECTYPSLKSLLGNPDFESHIDMAEALAGFVAHLHELGILHGDLNLSNILYSFDADGCPHFTVIDTNRSRFVSNPGVHECLDNMKRITHNRRLLEVVVRKYSAVRGLDGEDCVKYIMKRLDDFERRKRLKRRIFKKNKK